MPLKLSNAERPNMDEKMMEGVWLGLRPKSDEDIIGTPCGVVRARAVKRLAPAQQWGAQLLRSIKGTPRRPRPGSGSRGIPARPGPPQESDSEFEEENGNGEAGAGRQGTQFKGGGVGTGEAPERTFIPAPPEPRRRCAMQDEVQRHGPTDGCQKCQRPKVPGTSHM